MKREGVGVAMLLLALAACGARSGSVEGRVIDASGNPLSDVTISVEAKKATKNLSEPTGSDGRFAFDPPALFTPQQVNIESLLLTFSRDGFYPVRRRIDSLKKGVFQEADLRVEMARDEAVISISPDERAALNASKSIEGRTVFLADYSCEDSLLARSLRSEGFPGQVRRGISTHIQSLPVELFPADISVGTVPVRVPIENTERVRIYGTELNALAIVGGEVFRSQAEGEMCEIISDFTIIPAVEGLVLPTFGINVTIPVAEIGSAQMFEHLRSPWGPTALLAVAARECRDAMQKQPVDRASLERIRAYLQAELDATPSDEGLAAQEIRALRDLIDKELQTP